MTIKDQPASTYCQLAIDNDLLTWIADMVKNHRFGSRTHAVNYALTRLKAEEEKKAT